MGHGGSTPHLRQIAMKILNLTCNASGCERNFSTFEMYNQKLQERHPHLENNEREAIEAFDIDDACEWLMDADDDEAFPREGLTWGRVREAAGTSMPPCAYHSSSISKPNKGKDKAQQGKAMVKKRKRVMTSREDDEEEEVDSEETRDDAQYVEEEDDSDDDAPEDSLEHPTW
ncbi:hypothetical protein AMTR_s00064p00139280 [Amborella trichopoda]|uniref:HAT C-terminal dimerisation domain-containing protein n=1 Tax=Amborella trichopoda TaxID=13333 RepID=U5DC40_AMBTC|nr:hypothetical protein AMTR_s00064p00139280 [Amborella trichopoda]